jgi:hypothetical protein
MKNIKYYTVRTFPRSSLYFCLITTVVVVSFQCHYVYYKRDTQHNIESNKSTIVHTKGATSGAGTAYPSGEPEFIPVFSKVRFTRSLVLYVCFIDLCLFFWLLCCQLWRHVYCDVIDTPHPIFSMVTGTSPGYLPLLFSYSVYIACVVLLLC